MKQLYFVLLCVCIAYTTQAQTTFLTEDFGPGTCAIPTGWASTGGLSWDFSTADPGRGPGGDNTTGTGCYAQMDDSDGASARHLITPSIDLTGYTPTLTFYVFNSDASGGSPLSPVSEYSILHIDVSTNGGSTFTPDVAVVGDDIPAENYETWTQVTVDLSAYVSNATVIRFRGVEGSSFYSDLSLDDIELTGVLTCNIPTTTYTVVPDCGNRQFTIDVNVTALGDATGVDITDGTTTYQTNVGTGLYNIGPFAYNTNVTVQVNGSSYSGCNTNSTSLTEACACATSPTAVVNSVNLNCGTNTYDIQVTVNSDGSGDANKSDILIDAVVVQADATTGNMYTFNVAEGSHTVTVEAEGAGFATCTSIDYDESQSCNNDECTGAFLVQTDGTPRTSLDVTTYTSSATNLSCDAGASDEDAYYKFVAPASGMVLIDIDDTNLAGTSANRVEGALFASCGGAEVQCFGSSSSHFGSSTTASQLGRIASGLTPGNTYYLEIEHYNDNWTGTYDVIINDYAPSIAANTQVCLDLTDAVNINDLGSLGEPFNCSMFNSPEYTGSDEEEYLLYTPSSNQTINLLATSASYDDVDGIYIGMFEWTPGTNANCLGSTAGMVIDGGASSGQVSGISLTGGTTYVIVIGEDYNDGVSVCVEIQLECGSTSTNSIVSSDCLGNTYTGRVNFSNLGGAAVTYNLEDDASNIFTNISTATNYDFVYTDLIPHTVILKGYDGSSNLVCQEEIVVFNSGCNGTETCASAPNITNTCLPGNLVGAVNEGTLANNPSCGNGTSVRTCTGGFSPSSNYEDIWYEIDNSGGANNITVNITDLTGAEEVIVFLYDGGCTNSDMLVHTYQNPVTTSITAPAGGPGGSCAIFNSANSSFNFYNLSSYNTIYVRVMPYVNANNCVGLVNPTFTICAVVPQPNDVCNNAIDITINNGGVASNGDLSAAADEGIACLNGVTGKDLWYNVNNILSAAPNYTGPYNVIFTADGQTGDSMIVQLIDGCYTCPTITVLAQDTLVFASPDSTNFGNFELSGGISDYKIRVVDLGGTTNFTATAKLRAVNDICDYFNSPVTGFSLWDGSNPTVRNVDFNFGTENDLFYNFTSNAAVPMYSGTVDFIVNGLGVNESIEIEVYERTPLYSTDCGNLVQVGNPLTISSDGTFTYNCLNEFEGDYLVRVVNRGTDNAIFTLSAEPSQPAPVNDRCSNIWNGSSVTFNGAPFDLTGNTLNADFTPARDCDNYASDCSGVDLTADKDLWFYFTIPADNCPNLTASSKITEVTLTYDASNAFRDAKLFVYSDCNPANRLACSGNLDGAGASFTVSDLQNGETYLVRIKPSSLNSNNDYSFDLSATLGPVRPCNDESSDVQSLGNVISSGTDRTTCFNGPFSAQGATSSTNPASGTDVWLSFIAPNPANGQSYQIAESYVSIYLKSLSGPGNPYGLNLRVYEEVGLDNSIGVPLGENAVGTGGSITTNTNGDAWLSLGHLTPGEDYFIRISHNEPVTEEVLYDLCLYETATQDACSQSTIAIAEGVECADDCSRFYRISLPERSPSGYYRFEAIGRDGNDINTRMFFQPNETLGTNDGDITDVDQPCGVQSLVTEEAEGVLTDPGTCNGGTGHYGIYNLIGPATGFANMYYLEVYDETDLLGCGGLDICELNVSGPFSTIALAEANGSPDIVCTTPNTFPIELLSFTAENNGWQNELVWITASEVNNDYFVIEKSLNGIDFEDWQIVDAVGNSTEAQTYQTKDKNIYPITYYRLKQVDIDGTTSYSQIVAVKSSIPSEVVLLPNPAKNNIRVIMPLDKKVAFLAVIDALGQRKELAINQVGRNLEVDIESLKSGVYILQIYQDRAVVTQQFVKE
ncbi:MAG: T9SS type A sorting domain-containing protein [Aureispira sp.]|nr:T9SS type A sorting domain-containing protein [Aureispira sp.]